MDKELLQARINDIHKAIDDSYRAWQQTIGRMQEAQYMLQQLEMQELVDNGEAAE